MIFKRLLAFLLTIGFPLTVAFCIEAVGIRKENFAWISQGKTGL